MDRAPTPQAPDAAQERLVERLLHRDEAALREAMSYYAPAVYGMAKRIIVDATIAEEVAQDTFVALWRRPGAFDPQRGSLRSFLLGVARNKAIDRVRKEESLRRHQEELVDLHSSEEEISLDAADERTVVLGAVRSLSPVQQEAIVLAYYGGFTYREVAERLQIAEGTAKSRLRDGLTRLRAALGQGREG